MNNKWILLIVTIIMTSLIGVSCNQQQVISKQLDIEVIDAGCDNPVDTDNDVPYALYYSKNMGIQTRFAIGQNQIIHIVPINEFLIDEYDSRGVKIISID